MIANMAFANYRFLPCKFNWLNTNAVFGSDTTDLEAKLLDFQHYYNEHRTHAGRQGHPPVMGVNADHSLADLSCYRWQKHCRGLYQTPIAA
jgi:hypothetical protein